jgi:hypothetical protein
MVSRNSGDRAPRVICDGCQEIIGMSLTADNSDPNKNVVVDEMWTGKCDHCFYVFNLRLTLAEEEAT